MLGVSHLRNRRVLSNGFISLGKENLQLMYSDGDKAFRTSTELCVDERLRIETDGVVVVSMEILRPQSTESMVQRAIRGKIRITTRCLWLDKGKLLDTLHKAAHAALSSCPVYCPLAHIERTVSEVLREMVRKYSSKRPDVIVIAIENPAAVLAEDINVKLSGKSDISPRIVTSRKLADESPKRRQASKIQEEGVNTTPQRLEDDVIEDALTTGLTSNSIDRSESDNFWKSFLVPSPNKKDDNDSVSQEEHMENQERENSESGSVDIPVKSSKSVKRNKRKPEEIKKLIK